MFDGSPICPEIIMEDTSSQEDLYKSNFWTKIEDHLSITVPDNIKNILKINRLDNPAACALITNDVINEVEEFMRKEIHSIVPKEDLPKYYANFEKNPSRFRFFPGDKLLIMRISMYVQSKPESFWQIKNEIETKFDINNLMSPTTAENDNQNLNIDLERNTVIQIIENIFKDCRENLPADKSELLINAHSYVNVELIEESKVNENKVAKVERFLATVTCPVCFFEIKSKKLLATEKRSSRWILTNLTRHILKHSQTKPSKKNASSSA